MNEKENINKEIDYSKNPKGTKSEDFPNFLEILEDDTYKITFRNGDYIVVKELKYKKMKSIIDRCKNPEGKLDESALQSMLLINSIVYPDGFTENDLDEMKSGDAMRAFNALGKVMNIQDFL
jgi:hypothetical protein